jgi:hypothetical protein
MTITNEDIIRDVITKTKIDRKIAKRLIRAVLSI